MCAVKSNLILLRSQFKRRHIKGSEPCAIATAHILLQVVAKSKWRDVDTLLSNVARVGRRLVEAQPRELAISNIVRRVLGLIRDEAAEDRNDLSNELSSESPAQYLAGTTRGLEIPSQPRLSSTNTKEDSSGRPPILPTPSAAKSLFHILSGSPPSNSGSPSQGSPNATGVATPVSMHLSEQVSALRSEVIDGIEEIKDEIGQVDDLIATAAEMQINPGAYILIHQPSATVQRFILRAAAKRSFTVLMAAEPPGRISDDHQHASFVKKLSSNGICVINVMNGGLMAYMSAVDKVILGARAVVANGGVIVDAGAAAVARAAKAQGNPVVVLSGIYNLSPENPSDESSLVDWGDSARFVSYADGPLVGDVKIRSALTEFLTADLVDTYITNLYVAHATTTRITPSPLADTNLYILIQWNSFQGSPVESHCRPL